MKRPFSLWVMLVLFLIMSLEHFVGIINLLIPFSNTIIQYGFSSDTYTASIYIATKAIVLAVLFYGFFMTLSPNKHAKKVLLVAWSIYILAFLFRNYEAFSGTNDRYLKYENPAEQGGAMIVCMIQFMLYISVLWNLISSKKVANYLKVKAGISSTNNVDATRGC